MDLSKFDAIVHKFGWRLMADLAINELAAAAILGNLAHESNGFATLQEIKPTVKGSKGGYGWAHWTGPRRRAFEAFCTRMGMQPKTDEANYAYLLIELKGSEKAAVKAVQSGSLHDRVVAFEMAFERAGIKHYDSRVAYAELALEILKTNPTIADSVRSRPVAVAASNIDKPMVESKTNWTAGAMAALTGATTFFSTLNPYVQGMIIAAVIGGVIFIVFERYKKARAIRETVAVAAAS